VISCPQPGCHLPNSPWPGIIYSIPVPGRFGKKKSRNLIFFIVYPSSTSRYAIPANGRDTLGSQPKVEKFTQTGK